MPQRAAGPLFPTHYTGLLEMLMQAAASHVAQWKYRTTHQPSQFISASFSFAYALFEARRWNAHHMCTDTQISVIDTAAITSDAWLATELVGTRRSHAAFFARRAEEVLVYRHIPYRAGVSFPRLSAALDVACALADAAANPANNTTQEVVAFLEHSIAHSIEMLRDILPASMRYYDPQTHTDAVDAITRLAVLLFWWPKWITGVDPVAYPYWLQSVRDMVLAQLRADKAEFM
ncbi:hypothetical protein C8R44DRAFT_983173 [Mycena epipterygia]|nr:hypothetical protein C8R44DRAFT_983173 [Mycena epipterygia]